MLVSLARGPQAPGVELALPRGADAPNRMLPCRGRHGNADYLLGSPLCRRDFGAVGVDLFLAPSTISMPAAFWETFCGRRWRCS
jgi:hypothetical protein